MVEDTEMSEKPNVWIGFLQFWTSGNVQQQAFLQMHHVWGLTPF